MLHKNISILSRFAPLVFISLFVLLPLSGCTTLSSASPEEKVATLVTKSEQVFTEFWSSNEKPLVQMRKLYPDARGIVILPGAIKGGFMFGAEGGSGVLLARDISGRWGYPAFYTMAAGSFGLQVGGQVSDIVLLLFSEKAVRSLVKNQGKLGADLGLTIGTVSTGVEASTTTNVGADIMAFSSGVGIFAGGSIEGAVMITRNDFNNAYYGDEVTPAQIVLDAAVSNPAADKLRSVLTQN
ncbi:MAG: lipid-binding SYLF domain-containing protein [Rhodospirillaceae bacterium]|nr:lipid-binding SYLF domain-containing protein [Rhodospirillaceae bacterium]